MLFPEYGAQPAKRIVILHPHFSEPQRFPSNRILNDPSLVYMDLTGQDNTLSALQLRYAEIASDGPPRYVWLAGADATSDDILRDFVQQIATEGYTRIVIQTRRVPTTIITDPQLGAICEIWPVDKAEMLTDYVQDYPTIELFAFGGGRIVVNGQPRDDFTNQLGRQLLFFIADQGNAASREAIFQNPLRDYGARDMVGTLGVALTNVRNSLLPDCVSFVDDKYRLATDINWVYDVRLFESVVDGDLTQATFQQLDSVNRLYAADFLQGYSEGWITQRRAGLRAKRAQLLEAMRLRAAERGEVKRAEILAGQVQRYQAKS